MKLRTLIAGLCALGLAAAAAGMPAGRAPQDRPAPVVRQNEVSVVVKLVQVFVSDRYGKPVTGLELADFELLDNGQPQVLTAFEAHSLPLGRPQPVRPTDAAAGPARDRSALTAEGRRFYFVFDYFMNDPGGIRLAKKAACHFIDNGLADGDRAGILAVSVYKGLQIVSELTTDRAALKKAVEDMSDVTKLGSVDEVYVLANPPSSEGDEFDGTASDNEDKLRQCATYIRELRELGKALKAMDGIKNIVFFSRGLAIGALLQGGRQLLDTASGTHLVEDYAAMAQEMSGTGSPVYAVNTEGTRRLPPAGTNAYDNSLASGADALVRLASASGGAYFPEARNTLNLTDKIDVITAHYYVLGYAISPAWDGRYHDLKVRVKRPGCEVRAQPGYYDPKQYADFSPLEKNVQLMDLVAGKSSPFLVPHDIPLAALPYSGGDGYGPWNCILFAGLKPYELDDLAGPKAELFFFVFDEKRQAVWSKRCELELGGMGAGETVPYSPVALAPGRYEARVALRSLESGMASVGGATFTVSAPPPADAQDRDETGFRIDPPFLMQPGTEAAFLRAAADNEKETLPSLIAVYPFASVKSAPLAGRLETMASPLEAVVRVIPAAPGTALPDLIWSACLSPAGLPREIPLPATEVMAQPVGKVFAVLLELERPDLAPGEYALRIRAADAASGREARTEVRVQVK